MDLNKFIALIVAAGVSWLGIFLLRFKNAQNKIVRMEENEKDVGIKAKIHSLSDDDLALQLSKDLSPGDSHHGNGD